jgi:GH15 family glucan-1,4-alpha-glucosidase
MPDAGIWEYRKTWEPQTFSMLMSWAAADRSAHVLGTRDPTMSQEFRAAAARIRQSILDTCWDKGLDSFTATPLGKSLDASLLQMVPLRFLPRSDPRLGGTVDAVMSGLGRSGWIDRYRMDDGLGKPQVAFVLCTFWLIEALAGIGRGAVARNIMDEALRARSPLGLLSEDYDPGSALWGNYPQAYSHVGLIHAAFEASPAWKDVL